jgi:hypothetical protein
MTQAQALNILKMGESVFLTGCAGSGKTYVLNKYISYLRKNNIPVGITASTGIAATHLNGTTIHSWSGMGVADKLLNSQIKKLLTKKYLRDHFLNNVLIIDEVSMLHAGQLDMINRIAQAFRQNIQPFGGMQIILCGDFFQLPPISRDNKSSDFIFASDIWSKMNLRICYLHEQHRQDDLVFLNMLNQIRAGAGETVWKLLNDKIKVCIADETGKVTKLYTHNIDVDAINHGELNKISGNHREYPAEYHGNPNLVEFLKRSCLAMENLRIKIGASVMFIKNNFELGVVNGTVGKVVSYDDDGFPIIKITNGQKIPARPDVWVISENESVLAQIRQVPLRLAWAITVHKSQGMSLDSAEIDLSKSFQPGMGYVALSRVRNLAGLNLRGINEMALRVEPQILIFDKTLQDASVGVVNSLNKLTDDDILDRQEDFIMKYSDKSGKKIKKIKKESGKSLTLKMVKEKMILQDIAKKQNLKLETIINHLDKLQMDGQNLDLDYLKQSIKNFNKMASTFEKCGMEKLKPVYEKLKEKYSYDELKLVRVVLLANLV